MAVAVRIVKVVGPAISGTAGTTAQTFVVQEETTGITHALHVEVTNANKDDKAEWKIALEAVAPTYTVVDW